MKALKDLKKMKKRKMDDRERRWGKYQKLSKEEAVKVIWETLARLPLPWRRKHLRNALFYVEDSAVQITADGTLTVASCEKFGVIRIYLPFVWNRNHLEDILFHEIAHHLGLNEKEVRKLEGLDK